MVTGKRSPVFCIDFCIAKRNTAGYMGPSTRIFEVASPAKRKEHPLSMRLPEADIAMIDRAASLRGRSRTDFVRDAAVRAAEEAVMESTLVRMSPNGFDAFTAAITGRPAVVPEMVELLKRPAPWTTGDANS
jgi:uncharacterized protein (DUF1778 family)